MKRCKNVNIFSFVAEKLLAVIDVLVLRDIIILNAC